MARSKYKFIGGPFDKKFKLVNGKKWLSAPCPSGIGGFEYHHYELKKTESGLVAYVYLGVFDSPFHK